MVRRYLTTDHRKVIGMERDIVVRKVKDAVIKAGTTFRFDQIQAYRKVVTKEQNPRARWVLKNLLENAIVAEQSKSPLCDDTGIPHVLLEVGRNKQVSGDMIQAIYEGIAEGLRELPGRPMAIQGNDIDRLDQTGRLSEDPGAVLPAPVTIRTVDEDHIKLNVLLLGGGPEIRGRTYRVYHQHKLSSIMDEVVDWAVEGVTLLGCTPSVIAVGVGRTHYEATALMLEAMVHGNLEVQSSMEQEVTRRINQSNIGPLGLGGDITVLGTFLKVGPQRASGVRIVCVRPCCYLEPRIASVYLTD